MDAEIYQHQEFDYVSMHDSLGTRNLSKVDSSVVCVITWHDPVI
jgi:hypothetical protein